jgi:hypothetical protein
MTLREDQKELLRESAKIEDAPVELIEKLMNLTELEEFSDLKEYGAKTELCERIREIIIDMAGEKE